MAAADRADNALRTTFSSAETGSRILFSEESSPDLCSHVPRKFRGFAGAKLVGVVTQTWLLEKNREQRQCTFLGSDNRVFLCVAERDESRLETSLSRFYTALR